MTALAILLGFGILLNGSTFVAMQGRFAQELDLPGSTVIPYIPWLVLAGYFTAVLALRKIKRTRTRWIGFVVVTVIANTVIGYPIFLLYHGSTRIPTKDLMLLETQASFEAEYPVRSVSYSASREGSCIRVRNDQYSKEMASFVANLIKKQE